MKMNFYREKQLLSFLPVYVEDANGQYFKLSVDRKVNIELANSVKKICIKFIVFQKSIVLKSFGDTDVKVHFNLNSLRLGIFFTLFCCGIIAAPFFLIYQDVKAFSFLVIILLLAFKVIFDSLSLD